jgi:hypothetical protein
MTKDLMNLPLVTINWCAIDVKSVRPGWSDEQCVEALDSISGHLHSRSVELGWDVLEILIDMQYPKEDDEEDEE